MGQVVSVWREGRGGVLLVGERLDRFEFYMCSAERGDEKRLVYARSADELACKWLKAAVAEERLTLLYVVNSVGSFPDERTMPESESSLAGKRATPPSSFDEYLLERFSK